MGGGRYPLVHTDEPPRGRPRSGLGLRVRRRVDRHAPRHRHAVRRRVLHGLARPGPRPGRRRHATRPAAFDLDTLFIDEGFGSLDDDSLEQVLAVLDGLREGGRTVGIVSHVADLRTRITHQVVVHKGASGSTVEVRVGGAERPSRRLSPRTPPAAGRSRPGCGRRRRRRCGAPAASTSPSGRRRSGKAAVARGRRGGPTRRPGPAAGVRGVAQRVVVGGHDRPEPTCVDLAADRDHRVAEPVELGQVLALGRLDHQRAGHRERHRRRVEAVVDQPLGDVVDA